MSPIDPRQQAAMDAAVNLIKNAVAQVVDRVADLLGTLSLSATRIAERDLLLSTQFELRRGMASFHLTFRETLRESIAKDLAPREDGRRRLEVTDWTSLSLVGDQEVEEQLHSGRIAQAILQEAEWEQRDVAAHLGSLLRTGRPDEDRSPLRPQVVGAALYRAIESTTKDGESRKLLARELGQAVAKAMKQCYADIARDLQGRGVQPLGLNPRMGDGPGFHLPGAGNSGYSTLRDSGHGGHSGHSGYTSHPGSFDPGSGGAPAGAAVPSWRGGPGLAGVPGSGHGGYPAPGIGRSGGHGSANEALSPGARARADAQLMNLLRRLTALASRPGEFDDVPAMPDVVLPGTSGRGGLGGALAPGGHGFGAGADEAALHGGVAVNLIRAHRDELLQASAGKLDHMVIDVVGSLFDQILADPRVPPQMARQIARLQLPVLRVALADATFFSSRRHPVRRFVNRIASLALAFDEFDDGPGKQFLDRVRSLVQEIVEGDFDQIELYSAKLNELERFIADQTQGEVQASPAATTLENKESELRIQQRYMLQLTAALKPIPLAPYLREFLSQVWSQALVLAVRRDGPASDRFQRFKRVARDLVMSVQPKGSPALRKKFLMQLPPLMKDLNEGMALIGWPEPAQKAFFGQLLPAHAESLKAAPLSELDHNLLAKQIEGIFATTVPGVESLSVADMVPEAETALVEKRFTAEEAKQVGLVPESAVDWNGQVDIEVGDPAAPDAPAGADVEAELEAGDSAPVDLGLDIDLGLSPAEPAEPTRGPQLMDHVKLGFAYQMLLKDQWQKVRLTYVSPGRSFFVFSHGKKHQETISMTARMLSRMCETGRMRAYESSYLIERATARARKQLAALKVPATRH
ncbi:MAG: DUF1631 family protein [Piscinibacter sp.]|uniref:DUF1631 family protein n=1 Tax=Piscinibacter TaxID=1114981 RepID=UPI000FDE80DF|nr:MULTISPECIES: DUF1631 family protein [Piscinibacter]MCW5666002.1 DUF1631 family protein [Piscinibacter sp.]